MQQREQVCFEEREVSTSAKFAENEEKTGRIRISEKPILAFIRLGGFLGQVVEYTSLRI